jgi:hypothetical protein
LIPILRQSFPGLRVEDHSDFSAVALDQFDFQFSIAELGAAFRNTIDNFPKHKGFLVANPALRSALRSRYRKQDSGLVVGLSWSSINPKIGDLKSLPLADILTAVRGPERSFVSLQYGDWSTEIDEASRAHNVSMYVDTSIDPMVDLQGFVAQVAATDVVVTVSNTAAHISGALGIPTLLLLSNYRGRQWYWFRAFDHCPWYPSITYLSQSVDGSWDGAWKQCARLLNDIQTAARQSPTDDARRLGK